MWFLVIILTPSPKILSRSFAKNLFLKKTKKGGMVLSWSRFRHTVRRPGQIVCPNNDSVCPNSDKIYLMVVTFRFLLLFLHNEKRDLISPFQFVDCPLLASRRGRDVESKTPWRFGHKIVPKKIST